MLRQIVSQHRAQGRILSQPALDAVRDRMDHVVVDLVSNFAGEMRGPVRHALTWKRQSIWDAKKRRQHGRSEN
jgi:hypothetical protein